jgi:retron-type reverse transcriptase
MRPGWKIGLPFRTAEFTAALIERSRREECAFRKPDGRQRPLGVAALEDKIVQQAVVNILNQIYEEDFRGFSYGFRPGLQQASGAAVTTLLKLAMDTDTPPAVRARASYYILSLSKQWMDTDDIDARVAESQEAADRVQRER